jgi:uncharacterized protein
MSCESLCDKCVGLCCRYFALPIDNPESRTDFDNIRWYLAHENVVIFVEDKQWYIGVLNKCKHLLPDNRCQIYDTRPQICRGYSSKNCDYHGDEYAFDLLFTSAEELRVYAEKTLSKKRGRRVSLIPSPRPVTAKARRHALRLSALGSATNGHSNGNGHGNAHGKPNGRFSLRVI